METAVIVEECAFGDVTWQALHESKLGDTFREIFPWSSHCEREGAELSIHWEIVYANEQGRAVTRRVFYQAIGGPEEGEPTLEWYEFAA